MKVLIFLSALLLIVFGLPSTCLGQMWTYQGTQICYNSSPSNSMCFSQGTIASTAARLEEVEVEGRSFRPQQNAEGAAIGSLIGTLIAAWIEHHRRVEAEKKALKKELLAYLDAEIAVLQANKEFNEDSDGQLEQLTMLDPAHAQTWQAEEKRSREQIIPICEKQIQLVVNYRAIVDKKFHSRKGLDYALNDTKAGAKTAYQNALKLAAVSYVIDQLFRGLTGYFQAQGRGPMNQGVNAEQTASGEAVPKSAMRHLDVTVDSVETFTHEQRCDGEFCDGYTVTVHDDSITYSLTCTDRYDGDTDSDKTFDRSMKAKQCQPVRPGKWVADTDDKSFLFYSAPGVLAAAYQVNAEQKR